MQTSTMPVGGHIRQWRERRRLSQLDLAYSAEISPRHLSFVETGRSRPSREMILLLAEQLEIPVRERNVLLVAGGFAPVFQERPLDDPALAAARSAIDLVLAAYRPYPAFALDRHWNVVASNSALPALYDGIPDRLLAAPLNVLRLSLHPEGLAPRIENLGEWRAHLLHRLRRQVEVTADRGLVELEQELLTYPAPPAAAGPADGILVPLRIRAGDMVLSFFSTTMVFGTPLDVTLSELAVESFFPADDATITAVRNLGN
jgi:transcriptional regulator with XRE-family HTH domain